MKCPASDLDPETAEKVYPYVTFHGDEIEIPDDIWTAVTGGKTPGLLGQAGTLAKSSLHWALSGFQVVDEKTHLSRAVECSLCPRWDARAGRCLECGCYAVKLWLASERCPLARW